jgi:integrase
MRKIHPNIQETLDPQALSRAETLDILDSIFPFDRRDQLAQLLTDEDTLILKRLAQRNIAQNTLRALASDLGYLQAWARATTERPLPWPTPEEMVHAFISQHLRCAAAAPDGQSDCMPRHVEDSLRQRTLLRGSLPHAPSTVRRRIASWALLTRERGLSGPFDSASVKGAIKQAKHNGGHTPVSMSATSITDDILRRLLQACKKDGIVGRRDRAILLLAAEAGGQRRAEVASLRVEDLSIGGSNDVHKRHSRRTRLTVRIGAAERGNQLNLSGEAAKALMEWIREGDIDTGPVFRKIDQWGNVSRRMLTPQSVNLIVKTRAKKAGIDPSSVSAQGLRSGNPARARRRERNPSPAVATENEGRSEDVSIGGGT